MTVPASVQLVLSGVDTNDNYHLTTSQVAALFGVSRSGVTLWAREGHLSRVQRGQWNLFCDEDIRRALTAACIALYDLEEAATRLGVDLHAARQLDEQGLIAYLLISGGRFRRYTLPAVERSFGLPHESYLNSIRARQHVGLGHSPTLQKFLAEHGVPYGRYPGHKDLCIAADKLPRPIRQLDEPWLTPEEAAPRFGLSPSAVRRGVMRGEIEAVRLFGDKLAIPERVIPTLPAEPMVGSVEVARRLGRSRRWVALELERGHMRGYKTSECGKYRIPESEIARYLELWANEAKQATRKRTPQRKSNLNARPGVHRQRTVRVFG